MDNVLRFVPSHDNAERIGELYAKARQSATDSLEYLVEAGRELQITKDALAHGQWLRWLKTNEAVLGFKEWKAERLMKLAGKFVAGHEYGEKEVAELSEKEAAELIRWVWGHEGRSPKPYSGDDEWYTPAEYIERVRHVLGGIDLDPASNEQAQKIVAAERFFTKTDDALAQDWHGRVWLNPPYSKRLLLRFVSKLIQEYKAGNITVAIMLVNNFTDAGWFQLACSACAAVCFPRGRISFTNVVTGKIDNPINGQAFFYYGSDVESFRSQFASIGCGFAAVGSWSFNDPDDQWM